jgi:hypothetical protein
MNFPGNGVLGDFTLLAGDHGQFTEIPGPLDEPPPQYPQLPHAALVRMYHRLTGLAAECLLELRHI